MEDIDDIMAEARLEGDMDVWEMATEAASVRIAEDDLGGEWVISFVDSEEVTQYAYVDLEVPAASIVAWLITQGLNRRQIHMAE